MSRASAAYLVAILAALCTAGPVVAEAIPSELQQMLEAVEREETATHYAAAYVRLMEVERLAKQGSHTAALERIDELEPFLASASRRQVSQELDRYLRTQAAGNPDLVRQLGHPNEPNFATECAYDESARRYSCSASLEAGAFRCVAGEGAAVRCGPDE